MMGGKFAIKNGVCELPAVCLLLEVHGEKLGSSVNGALKRRRHADFVVDVVTGARKSFAVACFDGLRNTNDTLDELKRQRCHHLDLLVRVQSKNKQKAQIVT